MGFFFPSTFPCPFEWPSYEQCKTFQILENKVLRTFENRIIVSSDISQAKYIHIDFAVYIVVSQITAEHTQHAGMGPSADHKQSKSGAVQLHVCKCTKHSWSAPVCQVWGSQNHPGLALHTQSSWVIHTPSLPSWLWATVHWVILDLFIPWE